MSRGLVWFRRDLRLYDNPALAAAVKDNDDIVPVFVRDQRLLGRGPRDAFLSESLDDLYRSLGGKLLVVDGQPEKEIPRLAEAVGAETVYYNEDISPFALRRDGNTESHLKKLCISAEVHQGNYCIDIRLPQTAKGKPVVVFSNFFKKQQLLPRRPIIARPRKIIIADDISFAKPALIASPLSSPFCRGGEKRARRALQSWFKDGINTYSIRQNQLGLEASGFSAWLRFGNLSPRELEERCFAIGSEEALTFARQIAWRDFYAHVLFYYPNNLNQEFQPRYRKLRWDSNDELFQAWKEGQTGYPIVDAAMRQLKSSGFMHGRARMVVGSFLTKDLHLDWRLGQQWFDEMLLDGEPAQNNGNWQWIASTGVDPSPYFQRIFSPMRQQQRFDGDGDYIYRWVPELRQVPAAKLIEPWKISDEEQIEYSCLIGQDYPAPIVDHRNEREETIRRFKEVGPQ